MYVKTFIATLVSLLPLPFLASAQIKPGPSQTVCVIDDSVTPQGLATDPAWKNPDVKGLLIQRSWASLEPTEGVFDFSLLDQAVDLARQNGKFIGLAVGAGTLSPKWIYQAGAQSFRLGADSGKSELMPMPWDPVFFSAWGTLVEALGNRFDNDPTVAYVVMSGTGRDYNSLLARTSAEAASFKTAGGALFWTHAANNIADLFTTSFPHTETMAPLDPVIPGADGEKLVQAVVTEQVAAHADQLGFSSALLTSPALSQLPTFLDAPLAAQAPLALRLGSPAVARQVILTSQQSAVQKAALVQVSSQDLQQGGLHSVLQQANQQLPAQRLPSTLNNTGGPTSSTTSTTTSTTPATPPSTTTTAPVSRSLPTSTASNAAAAAAEAAYCTALNIAAKAAAFSHQEIWLSAEPSTRVSTGTQADPFHVSTATRLDAVMTELSQNQVPNLIFHFLPGTFLTTGKISQWNLSTGWQLLGSGESQTILRIDPQAISYTGSNLFADDRCVIFGNGHGHSVVRDMTLDGNCIGFGSQLSQSFSMPAPRATVTVNVQDSSPFTVGKWLYLQDSVQQNGRNTCYGLMEVTGIPSSTQVTLRNCEVPAAGTITGSMTAGSPVIKGVSSLANLDQFQAVSGAGIPSGSFVVAAGNGQVTMNANATSTNSHATVAYGSICVPGQGSWFCPLGNVAQGTTIPATTRLMLQIKAIGVVMGRTGDLIENVTVKNCAEPCYEGAVGICLNGFGTEVGLTVKDCTVRDLWGTCGWVISLTATQNAQIIGNTILGNGYNQGYALVIDNQNAVFQDNSSIDCNVSFFSDTGTKNNFTVSGNYFEGMNGIALMGATFMQSTFDHNSILVTQPNGFGMQFSLQMDNCTFDQNEIQVQHGVVNARGISLSSHCTGTRGNIFSNNVIDTAAVNNAYSPSYGTQSGNVDQNGNAINLGLAH